MWVRGLKHARGDGLDSDAGSHPMWVRGLKHGADVGDALTLCRTLCGCVD